jgi:phenylpropionate dioxygenase-like ring-hydroxylating dioxygenase large terminal subunit
MPDEKPDPVLWNDWHVVVESESLRAGQPFRTLLLGVPLDVILAGDGAMARREDGATLRSAMRYGFVWVCLGTPVQAILDIPEYAEDGRTITTGGSIGVHVSAGRVIENFLDLGHLGYVHNGYLGAEPHTEVRPYEVRPRPGGGIEARGCKIYQPMASVAAQSGYVVDYGWDVPRPLTTCLYKANPVHRDRFDVIYLFAQPVGEERAVAHALILFVADGTTEKELRWFQQRIFMQDKPILENQMPKRLPIGPRMEMPVLADKSSVAYRRWLREIGMTYGVIRDEAARNPVAA